MSHKYLHTDKLVNPFCRQNKGLYFNIQLLKSCHINTRLCLTHYHCAHATYRQLEDHSEEVRHSDVTTGVKRAWNVITADKATAFFTLRGIVLPVFFNICTSAGPVDALKVQSSNSNTRVSRIQVRSLSEGPTRGLGCSLNLSVNALSFLRISKQ